MSEGSFAGSVVQLLNCARGPTTLPGQITEGEVYLNDSTSASPFNYPAAEIWYTYRAIDQRWSGLCRVHFFDRVSAGYYAELHPRGSKVAVRYNPAVPKDSVMLEKDQLNPYPVAVAMQEHFFS